MPYQVAICGPRICTDADAANAYRIGALLAQQDVTVICGGGSGVMTAAAAGARSQNGLVIGIRPNDTRDGASAELDAVIVTNLGEARNAVIVWSADAVIVVGGSWGTLSELALAKRRGGISVVSIGGWRILDNSGQPVPGILEAATPEEAVQLAVGKAPDRP